MHLTRLLQRERSNKLANIDAVVASIAHEVRQPLAGIAIHGAAAKRYLNRAPPRLREVGSCIDSMVDASMHANDIFENIRTLFSSVNRPTQLVDLNQLTGEALGLLREELDAYRIETSMEQTPQLPSIMAHNGQLREVLLNLIQNAIDAMKGVSDRRRVLRIRTARHDNEAVSISVEDTGPGIGPEKRNRVFEPFFSTKAKGMGLGLAICKSIVERHHGQLSVSSEIGRGTRFDLILPIKPVAHHELPSDLADLLRLPSYSPDKSAYS
jgi:signal transduction histidine kinase